jgi:hypothetical protein
MDGEDDKTTEHQESHINAEVSEHQSFSPIGNEHSEVKIGADAVDDSVVTWEASEYINHQKSMNWYLGLTGATLLLGAILYLLVRDIFSLVVLVVMYIAIIVYAKREPRVLRYSVSADGISIGDKHFNYNQLHSFSAIQESGVPSIVLTPTQRFMPPISIYFAPADSENIINELSKFLPNEQKNLNLVDRTMLKLRF